MLRKGVSEERHGLRSVPRNLMQGLGDMKRSQGRSTEG